jgi:hypothetical protein
MSKPIIRIHNAETNEIIDREMNEQEYAVYEKDLELSAKIAEEKTEAIAAKAAAEAKLEALGLTPEDLKALALGWNNL